jgi:hypothetical protein
MQVNTAPPPAPLEQPVREHQPKVEEQKAPEQPRDEVSLSAESLRLADEAQRDTVEKQRGSLDPTMMS